MSFQVSIKALIFDQHQNLLLAQEDSGVWDLPGGRMEHGESFHEALSRECREEMSVCGAIIDTVPFWAWSILHSDGYWKVILCFRMDLSTEALLARWKPSSECKRIHFFSPDALVQLDLAQQMIPLAMHWRSGLQQR